MKKYELHEDPYRPGDVYRYDHLPRPLKVQIFSLIEQNAVHRCESPRDRAIREYRMQNSLAQGKVPADTDAFPPERYLLHRSEVLRKMVNVYEFTVQELCYRYGVEELPELPFYQKEAENDTNVLVAYVPDSESPRDFKEELKNFFSKEKGINHDLHAIKLAFNFISDFAPPRQKEIFVSPAIEEMNSKFRQHSIGYEFRDGKFLRIDSQFVHAQVVKPALALLTDPDYSRAQEEFMAAHGYHLEGDSKTALNECSKSLESVLKIICEKRKWQHDDRDGFGKLLEKVTEKGLIPKRWNTLFPALNNLLAGVSKARNELSGHGRGSQEAVSIPPYVAAYAMHMTAAAILFLMEAEKDIQKS